MTLPRGHMRMCNTLFKAKFSASFAIALYIRKLVRMVVYIVQMKAKLLITKNDWFISCVKRFFVLYSSSTALWSAFH